MNRSDAKAVLKWLTGHPPLQELLDRYPDEWEEAGGKLVAALENAGALTTDEAAASARSDMEIWQRRIAQSGHNPKVIESALPHLIKGRMFLQGLEKCTLAAATGKSSGKIRFNLFNGWIIQRLLFRKGLERKSVSLGWFKVWWPLITQKRFLMPLVQSRGIYCFYSTALIEALAELIDRRSCLEIAAGDGTLASLLTEAGVPVTATDNFSWTHAIHYPDRVEKLGAKEALEKYQPRVVLCSWPPPGNPFEKEVFLTPSVELYVVIGSRYRFAGGNWEAYTCQQRFDWRADPRLSRFVLPPELESSVLVFHRKNS
jgi:hypothetical protein